MKLQEKVVEQAQDMNQRFHKTDLDLCQEGIYISYFPIEMTHGKKI